MELNTDIPTQPPRDASTLVLLRDGAQGLEVFLVRRHSASQVLGGAYVFPGGKLDAADAALHHSHLNLTPQALHTRLGESDTPVAKASALFVAALRETFEEAGVLLADPPGAIKAGAQAGNFHTLLADHGLRLDVAAVQPWVRWITPRMPSVSSARFDARFFVAAMPPNQTAAHDNVEATASAWLRPRHALAQYWNGAIALAPPQLMSLAYLARHHRVADALAELAQRAPATVLPESHDRDGQRVICYPGDPGHSVPSRALPGPTRLVWRNQRFEPDGGLEAFWTDEGPGNHPRL
jgi:8-oxo-dGTP pyrophosphatase MutT (NUDIX family)